MRRGLLAGNQVHIRGAIRQRCHQVLHKLGQRNGSPQDKLTSLCLAAENHDGSGPEVLHLVDAQLANLGTVKSRRDKRVNYWDLVVTLYFGCACELRACEEAPAPGLNGFAVSEPAQGEQ